MRIVEPFGAGGGPDIVARILAPELAKRTGGTVEVLNLPGAGSTAGPAFVLAAPGDGETLLLSTSAHAYSRAAVADLPYDPLVDFVAVAGLTTQAYVVVASVGSGVEDVAALRAAGARRRLRYASTGRGTGTHVGSEVLHRLLEIAAVHVPAEGDEGIADVLAKVVRGDVDHAMVPTSIAKEPIAEGRVVALGVTSAQRTAALPDIPSLAEVGATGYDFPIWYGAWAAGSTPQPLVEARGKLLVDVLGQPHVRDELERHAMQVQPMAGESFARFVHEEARRAEGLLADRHNRPGDDGVRGPSRS